MEAITALRRPVLRYHGGKWLLAPWIIQHMPAHRVYVEAFGGGGSVLMRKPRSYAEVYNDLWSSVVNVFRVLRDATSAAQLERQLRLTPFSREEFEADFPSDDVPPLERARRSILRSFAGFGSASTNGDYPTGFRCNSNRSGTTPAHDWANFPDYIKTFTERLTGVVIENRPAIDVIKQQDSADSLIYCDPPYVHSTRNMNRGNAAYAHEMSDADHEQLSEVLHGCEGMVMLSGYRSDLYDSLYRDWETRELATHGDNAVDRVETLWLNPACASRQQQIRMFA